MWILSECHREFKKLPWHDKALSHTGPSGKVSQAVLNANKATYAWEKVFYTAESGFVTKPELGMPDDGRFYYNVKASEKREKNVSMLCKAEANLDEFWKHVDDNINRIVDNYQQGVLQDLLDGSGKMHRTIPWDQREHSKREEKPTPAHEIVDFNAVPLSQIFHGSSKEITGNFNKSSIAVKSKEKTHGVPAEVAEEEAGPAREPSPEPPREFLVNKEDLANCPRALLYSRRDIQGSCDPLG